MTAIVQIDDETVSVGEFVRMLKLTGRFSGLVDDLIREKLTVHAAKKQGVTVSPEEIQDRADQFRRAHGLHRAADTNNYLDSLAISLDEFETFITDSLYQEKMMDKVCNDAAVDEYFKLNSPKFDCIEVSHIVVDNEGMAKEMVSALSEDPESFPAMAREYSIAETRETGGQIGKVLRGSLKTDIEAKVFNSAVGELLGPFQSADGSFFELFIVNAKHPAKLDDETKTEVRRRLREEWLMARSQEHLIQAR